MENGGKDLGLSRLGLGGVLFGREIDEKSSRKILDYALEQDITLIDTAESYGGGNARSCRRKNCGTEDVREVSNEMHSSEKIIGRWLRDRDNRNEVTLCTKFSTGGHATNVHRAVGESLERLQTDVIDIYMMHLPDPDVPLEETLEALTKEVNEGRIRAIGCSNFSHLQLVEALELSQTRGYARMEFIQPPFSLADSGTRLALLPLCLEQKVTIMAYSPLAAGFLSGKYSPFRDSIPRGSRFDVSPGHIDLYFNEHNFQILESLRALSKELGTSMVHLAMAWVISYPGISSVLVGARDKSQIDNALHCLRNPVSTELHQRMTNWLSD